MHLKRLALAALFSLSMVGCTTAPNQLAVNTTQKIIQYERNKSDLEIKALTLASGDKMVYAENGNVAGEPLLLIHVGGNSMGGAISVAYAAKYPKDIKSLWLVDSAGFWSAGIPKSLEGATLENNPLLINSNEDFYKMYDFVMYKPPYLPKSVKAVFAQERIKNKELDAKILEQIVTDNVEERAKIIAQYNIPTLVVWGDKDQIIKPETVNLIKKIIPQAQVIMMPEIGHVPMIEAVEQTADDYKAFRSILDAQR